MHFFVAWNRWSNFFFPQSWNYRHCWACCKESCFLLRNSLFHPHQSRKSFKSLKESELPCLKRKKSQIQCLLTYVHFCLLYWLYDKKKVKIGLFPVTFEWCSFNFCQSSIVFLNIVGNKTFYWDICIL